MKKTLWIRVAAWTALLIVIAFFCYYDRKDGEAVPSAPTDGPVIHTGQLDLRHATADEWGLPLVELGRRQLARRVLYHHLDIEGPVMGTKSDARGVLAHLDAGQGERLVYIPHPAEIADERPAIDAWARLYKAIASGTTLLLPYSETAPLTIERIPELPVDYALPPGWAVVAAPDTNLD